MPIHVGAVMMPDTPFTYTKSSFSAQGDCVGWHQTSDRVFVGDTKNPNGPALQLTPGEWLDFTESVASGNRLPGRIAWSREGTMYVVAAAAHASASLRFTSSEWHAFRAAI